MILLNKGEKIIKAQYFDESGEFVLITPLDYIFFGCNGGSYISVSGDENKVKNTTIKNAIIQQYEDYTTIFNRYGK